MSDHPTFRLSERVRRWAAQRPGAVPRPGAAPPPCVGCGDKQVAPADDDERKDGA